MTFKEIIKEIKLGKKVKHKTWDTLIIEGYHNHLEVFMCVSNTNEIYYFKDNDFIERFGKFEKDWVIISDAEYIDFIDRAYENKDNYNKLIKRAKLNEANINKANVDRDITNWVDTSGGMTKLLEAHLEFNAKLQKLLDNIDKYLAEHNK